MSNRRGHFDAGHGMPSHSASNDPDIARAQASHQAAEDEMAYWADFEHKLANRELRDNPEYGEEYGDYLGGEDPVQIAADWHGGQGSAMYGFASTGRITDKHGLLQEIQSNIDHPATSDYEAQRLQSLYDYASNPYVD